MTNKRSATQGQPQFEAQVIDPLLVQLDDEIERKRLFHANCQATLAGAEEKITSLGARSGAVELRCAARDEKRAAQIAAHRAAGDAATMAGDDAAASIEFGKAVELETASANADADQRTEEMQRDSLRVALRLALAERDQAQVKLAAACSDLDDAQSDRLLAIADLLAEAYLEALAEAEPLPNMYREFSIPLGLSTAYRLSKTGNVGYFAEWVTGNKLDGRILRHRLSKGRGSV